jgi:hypothetical protein
MAGSSHIGDRRQQLLDPLMRDAEEFRGVAPRHPESPGKVGRRVAPVGLRTAGARPNPVLSPSCS